MDSAVVGQIYEAAFLPEGWPAALDSIVARVEARGSIMFVANPQANFMKLAASNEIRTLAEEYAAGGWPQRDGKLERILQSGRAGFITDYELYSEAELLRSEAHSQFMRPRGLGDGAGMAIASPSSPISARFQACTCGATSSNRSNASASAAAKNSSAPAIS